MDMHDRELDSLITLALQPQPVTSQQKQRAWEQLQSKLVRETVQPIIQPPPSLYDAMVQVFQSIWQSLLSLAMEETRYHNARHEQYTFRYYSFSSSPVSFAMELIGPLRTTSMGQVC